VPKISTQPREKHQNPVAIGSLGRGEKEGRRERGKRHGVESKRCHGRSSGIGGGRSLAAEREEGTKILKKGKRRLQRRVFQDGSLVLRKGQELFQPREKGCNTTDGVFQ